MIWYNMKEMSKHYSINYRKIKGLNIGNVKEKRKVELLMLTYFSEKVELDKKELSLLQYFFKRKKGVREEIESLKEIKNLGEEFWQIDNDFLEIGRELYLWDLSREDLKAINQIKTRR